jgi:L-lactate dehydrogenase (cytochrome)
MNMRLIGANKIEDLSPDMVDTRGLFTHTVPTAVDSLSNAAYDALAAPAFAEKSKL